LRLFSPGFPVVLRVSGFCRYLLSCLVFSAFVPFLPICKSFFYRRLPISSGVMVLEDSLSFSPSMSFSYPTRTLLPFSFRLYGGPNRFPFWIPSLGAEWAQSRVFPQDRGCSGSHFLSAACLPRVFSPFPLSLVFFFLRDLCFFPGHLPEAVVTGFIIF